MVTSPELDPEAGGTPVLPYIKLVPSGIVRGGTHLRVTAVITPELAEEGESTSLRLERWPETISDLLDSKDWMLKLMMRRVPAELPCDGAGQPSLPLISDLPDQTVVEATATRLKDTYRRKSDVNRLGDAWRKALAGRNLDGARWKALGRMLSGSVKGDRFQPDRNRMESEDDQGFEKPDFGNEGQLAAPNRNAETKDRIVSLLSLPHSDFALFFGRERAKEILEGLQEGVDTVPETRVSRLLERAALSAERSRVQKDALPTLTELQKEKMDEARAQLSGAVAALEDARRAQYSSQSARNTAINQRKKTVDELESATQTLRESFSMKGKEGLGAAGERKKAEKEERFKALFERATDRRAAARKAFKDAVSDQQKRCAANMAPPARSDLSEDDNFEKAAEIYEYGTWEQRGDTEAQNASGSDIAKHMMRAYAAIQTNPVMARLFGLVIDLEVPLEALPKEKEVFIVLAATLRAELGSTARATPWTLSRLARQDETPADFWPADIAEIDSVRAAVAPMRAGRVVMGLGWHPGQDEHSPRFDLTGLDVRAATEMEMQRRGNVAVAAQDTTRGGSDTAVTKEALRLAARDAAQAHTLQTPGLTVLDRMAMPMAARKLAAAAAKSECSGSAGECVEPAAGDGASCCLLLEASDLVIGHRLEIGVPAGRDPLMTEWRPLLNRIATYTDIGGAFNVEALLDRLVGGDGARMSLESPTLGQMSRLLPYGTHSDGVAGIDNVHNGEAVVEEAGELWDGGPMGVFCGQDLNNVPAQEILPYKRRLSLPTAGDQRPPKLRFGWAYRLLKPAVFAGGISPTRPSGQTVQEIEKLKLAYPPSPSGNTNDGKAYQPFQRYLRHSRLGALQVVVPSKHAVADRGGQPFENGSRMIVRSVRRPWGQRANGPIDPVLADREIPDIAQRFLVVPSLAQDDAARHGVFDGSNSDTKPPGALSDMRLHHTPSRFPVAQTVTTSGLDQLQFIESRKVIRPRGPSNTPQSVQRAQDPVMEYDGGNSSTFYPDPAADHLVMALRHRETDRYFDGSIATKLDQERYPNLLQVCLTVERLQGPRKTPIKGIEDLQPRNFLGEVAALEEKRFNPNLSGDVFGSKRTSTRAWDVRLYLAAGEEFELDVWLVPSAKRLAREFAAIEAIATAPNPADGAGVGVSVEGLKDYLKAFCPSSKTQEIDVLLDEVTQADGGFVAPGGIIGPHPQTLMKIATLVHSWMMCRPLRELAAVTTLDLVHAVNRPALEPVINAPSVPSIRPQQDNREDFLVLRRDLNLTSPKVERDAAHLWRDAPIMPASTGFALSGDVTMDLCDSDVLELFGQIALPPGSVFDDSANRRSLIKRRAGEWPTYVDPNGDTVLRDPQDIFGFEVIPQTGFTATEKSPQIFLRVEDLVAKVKDGETVGQLAPCGNVRFDVAPFFAEIQPAEDGTMSVDPRGKISVGGILTPADGTGDIEVWVEGRAISPFKLDDTKAREITVQARAISRTVGLFDTVNRIASNGDLVQGQPLRPEWQTATGQALTLAVPTSERPAACDALTPHPVFRHTVDDLVSERALIRHQRKAWVRIRLERGWFSSGENERIGVVLWPPMLTPKDMQDIEDNRIPLRRNEDGSSALADLAMFSDDDLGIGGKFVTRKGADPIRGGGREDRVFLGLHDFPHVHFGSEPPVDPLHPHYIPNVVMPVNKLPTGNPSMATQVETKDDTTVPDETLTVGLLALKPRFDLEEEIWYADLLVEPELATDPFLRLGLVRYQAYADGGYEVSSPVQQWVQLLPERTLEIEPGPDPDRLSIQLFGQSSIAVKDVGYGDELRNGTFARPVVRVHFLRETNDGPVPIREALVIDKDNDETARTLLVPGSVKNGTTYWRFDLPRPDPALGSHVLYIEEVDMRRPATYDVEPITVEQLKDEDPFVPSGPRYAAKLVIDPLLNLEGGK